MEQLDIGPPSTTARGEFTPTALFAVRPELIDPEKFGVLAARNAGLIGDVFPSREQARAWLDAALSGMAQPPAS